MTTVTRDDMIAGLEAAGIAVRPYVKNTAETAPSDTPILVWVRGVNGDGKGDWRIGRVRRGYGLPDKLCADYCHGDWDIPFWAPLPAPAENES